jgi:hypothetical protein
MTELMLSRLRYDGVCSKSEWHYRKQQFTCMCRRPYAQGEELLRISTGPVGDRPANGNWTGMETGWAAEVRVDRVT